MVKKKFPWHADINNFVAGYSLVDRDIQHLKDLNINVIRLGRSLVVYFVVCLCFVGVLWKMAN